MLFFSMIDKQEYIEMVVCVFKVIVYFLCLKIFCVFGDQEVCVQDIVDVVGIL